MISDWLFVSQFLSLVSCCIIYSFPCLQYVRVATKLYTKIWKQKYEESSVIYMMDPTFVVVNLFVPSIILTALLFYPHY